MNRTNQNPDNLLPYTHTCSIITIIILRLHFSGTLSATPFMPVHIWPFVSMEGDVLTPCSQRWPTIKGIKVESIILPIIFNVSASLWTHLWHRLTAIRSTHKRWRRASRRMCRRVSLLASSRSYGCASTILFGTASITISWEARSMVGRRSWCSFSPSRECFSFESSCSGADNGAGYSARVELNGLSLL